MSLREDMWKYEQITGESAEHIPIIKLTAFLDGYEMGLTQNISNIIEFIREFDNKHPALFVDYMQEFNNHPISEIIEYMWDMYYLIEDIKYILPEGESEE